MNKGVLTVEFDESWYALDHDVQRALYQHGNWLPNNLANNTVGGNLLLGHPVAQTDMARLHEEEIRTRGSNMVQRKQIVAMCLFVWVARPTGNSEAALDRYEKTLAAKADPDFRERAALERLAHWQRTNP